jgi:hypothetical protein
MAYEVLWKGASEPHLPPMNTMISALAEIIEQFSSMDRVMK